MRAIVAAAALAAGLWAGEAEAVRYFQYQVTAYSDDDHFYTSSGNSRSYPIEAHFTLDIDSSTLTGTVGDPATFASYSINSDYFTLQAYAAQTQESAGFTIEFSPAASFDPTPYGYETLSESDFTSALYQAQRTAYHQEYTITGHVFSLVVIGSDTPFSGPSFTFGYPQPSVPEPATWAMLVSGFGLVGGALRTFRRAAIVTV